MPKLSRTLINTAIVALGYLLSRLLGVIRDIFITAQFGTAPVVDAYRAAFAIPDLLYLVIAGGALGTALIPVFQQRKLTSTSSEAWQLANSVITLALPLLVGAATVAWIWAEPLVRLTTARGFAPELQQQTAYLMRMLLIQPILLGIGGIVKALLESHDNFATPTLGANLYNIGIIAGAAILAPWFGIDGVVYGVIIGAVAFLGVQISPLRRLGWQYHAHVEWPSADLREIARLLVPRLFGQSIWQINLTVMIAIASTFGVGAVAASGYALQIMLLPHGLIGLSVGTVVFPLLARLYAAGHNEQFVTRANQALQSVLVVTIPAAFVLWSGAPAIVKLLYQRGSFDSASLFLTIAAVQGYAIGLAGFSVAEIAVRIWFARKDTRTPVVIGAITVTANVLGGWWLTREGALVTQLQMLTTVFSVTNILEGALLIGMLQYRQPGITIWQHPWHWLLSVVGMVVLWQGSIRILPALPLHPAQDWHDWRIIGAHLGSSALIFGWGVLTSSRWLRVIRDSRGTPATHQGSEGVSA
jgi:putative peptidoglycan lipid II flippase